MKALILAAGRGQRMRPLTDHTPKPLLPVLGKPLIVWHLEALARGGVQDVVINTAWLEDQIPAALGEGSRFGLRIHYSMEGRDHGGALETAGGIAKALPWLGDAFWLVSGDIYAPGFEFEPAVFQQFANETGPAARLAHLWLVPNPPYHPRGDFGLDAEGWGLADAVGSDGLRHTYANLALCRAALCAAIPVGMVAALGPLLFEGMRQRRISAELYPGRWENVGTPQQLAALDLSSPAPKGNKS